MAACDFTLSHNHSPEYLFSVVRAAVQREGGQLTGNPREGSLALPSPAGRIEGTYATRGKSLRVLITSKPFVVPCSVIQRELADLLAQVPPEVIEIPQPDARPDVPVGPPAPPQPLEEAEDWLWQEELKRRAREASLEAEPALEVPQSPGQRGRARWGLLLGATVLAAGGVLLWRSQRA